MKATAVDAPIRLGLLAPLSGVVALYGFEIVNAAAIACQEINETGGLLGRKLELCVEDDGSLPESALPAAQRLFDAGCVALIGTLLSNSRIVVADLADRTGIPLLNFSFNEGSVQRRHVFHFAAVPNQQIERMIPFMVAEAGPKMFFAGNNYEWPRGSVDAAKRVLEAAEGEVVGEVYLPIGADIDAIDHLIDAVARSGADVFVPYFAGYDQIHVLERFHAYGLKRRMAVVTGHFDEVMAARLAPEVREGIYSSNTFFMTVDTAEAKQLRSRLSAQAGGNALWPEGTTTLTNFAEAAYVCVQAFGHAVRAGSSLLAPDLVAALEQVAFDAPQGRIRMDARTHYAWVNSMLARCSRDGTFEIVRAFGCLAPEIPKRYAHSPEASVAGRQLQRAELPTSDTSDHWGGAADLILSAIDVAIVATDGEGRIFGANRRTCELFGYGIEELRAMTMHDLVPPHLREVHRLHVARFVASDSSSRKMAAYRTSAVVGYRKDGSFFPIDASIVKLRDGDGFTLVAALNDISASHQAQEELTRRATHDALTGLPNRTMIRERISAALHRAERTDRRCAVLFIDLDGFKQVNDSYGHEVGDSLLRLVADRLGQQLRPGDTLARLAGDEFVVLCEQVATPSDASALAERLLNVLQEPFHIGELALSSAASIGIVMDEGQLRSADELLRAADAAMYAVKEAGRGHWRFFNAVLQAEMHQRMTILRGLRRARERSQLAVHYQPIVNVLDGRIIGAEALMRWNSDEGPISPAVFIPIAETSGLIGELGRWVFEQACRAEVGWRQRWGIDAPYVSVNLSARQLVEPALAADIERILHDTGADASRLVLEITETSLMADVESSEAALRRLTALGLRVAVDDFGTGYSSLAYLVRLPVAILKIDRTFVNGLEGSKEKRAIVRTVVGLAHSLDLKLVAEGVETAEQQAELRAYGCDQMQGFLFHRPQDSTQFIQTVDDERATLATAPASERQ